MEEEDVLEGTNEIKDKILNKDTKDLQTGITVNKTNNRKGETNTETI